MNGSGQGPRRIGRKELYDLVWTKPMVHAGADLGLSGNGLAKVCRKLDVPYPQRGYWAKLAVGKAPPADPLPAKKGNTPGEAVIRGSSSSAEDEVPQIAGARRRLATEMSKDRSIVVPERLAQPHPVIAKWLEEKNASKQRARRELELWGREIYREPDFTSSDRRRHRILHALFKALEQEGGRVTETDRKQLIYEQDGERIEFQLREKHRRVRRPLTESEARWRSPSDPDWRYDLERTGNLIFEIKGYLSTGLRSEWLESETRSIESMLGEIAATFAATIPLLVERRREREEAEQRYQEAMRERQAEEQWRQLDEARWRKFLELAATMHEVQLGRELLDRLRADRPDLAALVGEDSLQDWIDWVETRIEAADPLKRGAAGVFDEIARVDRCTYRE